MTQNGFLAGFGTIPDGYPLPTLPGMTTIEGDPPSTLTAQPPSPGASYVWNTTTNQYDDTRTLAQLQAVKNVQIDKDRAAACIVNVTALGTTWQADLDSQALLSQAITLVTAGYSLPPVWRDANNNNVAITSLADLMSIAGTIAAQTQDAYTNSRNRKAAVAAATTAAEVAAA